MRSSIRFRSPIPWRAYLGMLALLLLFIAADADAQRSRRQGRDRRGRTSTVKKDSRMRTSQSNRARTTTRTREQSDPAQVVGPADLAQQALDGATLDAPARTKRPAPPSPPITAEQLALLAAYQREVEGVPLKGYAEPERPAPPLRPLYAEGSFGMYLTAALRAGYSGNSWPYDYSAHLAAQTTNGFEDNGSRSGISVGANGGYIIDDGYGIFSGGHMGADVDYISEKYRRYALPDAPERSRGAWSIGMDGQNSYNGTAFELYGKYRRLTLTEATEVGESSLDGGLDIRVPYMGLTVGGETDLRLTYLAGKSISFGRLSGYAKYSNAVFALRGGVSIGAGDNSDNSTTVKIAPLAEVDLFPMHGVTITAALTGGLSQNSLGQLLATNPYVTSNPLIQHEVESIGYRGTLRIEPTQSFALRLTAGRGDYDHYSYFRETADALFAPEYGVATVTKVMGDLQWEISQRALFAATATFVESRLDQDGSQVPFVPKWDAEILYTQRLASIPLTITGSARYIGERDGIGGNRMEAVPLLGLKGRYTITSLFDVTLELANLANTRYELWPGYRERGLFGAVGLGVRY